MMEVLESPKKVDMTDRPPSPSGHPQDVQASRLPPRVGLPLVGALPSLIRNPGSFLLSSRARHGDVYSIDLGPTRCIALNHPRHAQHVLRDNARNYSKGGPLWDSIADILGDGLPTSDGALWLRQRRMLQPHFHRERLLNMTALMMKAIHENLQEWEQAAASGEPFDAYNGFARMAMNMVVKTMLGADISTAEADTVAREMDYAVGFLLAGVLAHSLPGWLPFPGRQRFKQAIQTIDEILFRLIEQHRSKPSKTGGDLLGMMLDSVDAETGERMSDREIRDEAISIFLAGYETSCSAMSFALALLLERPELLQSVRTEIDETLGRDQGGQMIRLPLTLMVLQETLRLYPPSYWIPRTAVAEDVVDGFRIPAGSMVALMTYAIHHHPDSWERPEQFDPWRFSPERSAGRHPLAWLPFGGGQRQCIGKDFALMEGQLVFAQLLSRYEIEFVPGYRMEPNFAVALRPRGGVQVKVRKRQTGAPASPVTAVG